MGSAAWVRKGCPKCGGDQYTEQDNSLPGQEILRCLQCGKEQYRAVPGPYSDRSCDLHPNVIQAEETASSVAYLRYELGMQVDSAAALTGVAARTVYRATNRVREERGLDPAMNRWKGKEGRHAAPRPRVASG